METTAIENSILNALEQIGDYWVPEHMVKFVLGIREEENLDGPLEALIKKGLIERGRFRTDTYKICQYCTWEPPQ